MNKLLRMADDDFWGKIYERYQSNGGVYKLIAVDSEQRQPINRFLGTDTNGILYVGKATSFIKRVIDLKKSILLNGSNHKCGTRYKSNPSIAIKFPSNMLYLDLIPSEEPDELEKKLLFEYTQTFGEVPPLNAVGN